MLLRSGQRGFQMVGTLRILRFFLVPAVVLTGAGIAQPADRAREFVAHGANSTQAI